jgi:hypothetical protein
MGSEFTVHLPVVEADVPAASAPVGDRAESPRPATLRILVVDDNLSRVTEFF